MLSRFVLVLMLHFTASRRDNKSYCLVFVYLSSSRVITSFSLPWPPVISCLSTKRILLKMGKVWTNCSWSDFSSKANGNFIFWGEQPWMPRTYTSIYAAHLGIIRINFSEVLITVNATVYTVNKTIGGIFHQVLSARHGKPWEYGKGLAVRRYIDSNWASAYAGLWLMSYLSTVHFSNQDACKVRPEEPWICPCCSIITVRLSHSSHWKLQVAGNLLVLVDT